VESRLAVVIGPKSGWKPAGRPVRLSPSASLSDLGFLQVASVLILFLGLLAGKFSLDRLGFSVDGAFWGNQVAIWFFVVLGLLSLLRFDIWRLRRPRSAMITSYVGSVTFLFLFMVTSLAWSASSQPLVGVMAFQLVLFVGFFLLSPRVFTPHTGSAIDFFLGLCFWAGLIYAVAGILGVSSPDPQARMAAFGGGPNVFVRVVGGGALLSLLWWIDTGKLRWLVPLSVTLYAAAFSGSRGGVIAIAAAMGFLVLKMVRLSRIWRFCLRFAVGGTVLTSALSIAYIYNDRFSRFVDSRYIVLTSQRLYLSQRDRIFGEVWEIFLNNPLFGIGFDGYAASTDGIRAYPHNFILQLAAEGGMIALFSFLLAASVFLVSFMIQHKSAGTRECALLSLTVLYFVASLASGSIYDSRFFWSLVLLFVMSDPRTQISGQQGRMVVLSPSQIPGRRDLAGK